MTRVLDPPTETDGGDGHILGVLLAAGRSRRYGTSNKLLAEIDGKPLVRHAQHTLQASDVDALLAVVGFEDDRVVSALGDIPTVRNDNWRDGIGATVACGARTAVSRGADAVVFALGDMPWVAPESVTALCSTYRAEMGSALAAAYRGQRGNPVLFGRRHFEALAALDGEAGGSVVFEQATNSALVETGDPGVRRDIDRRADLESGRRQDS